MVSRVPVLSSKRLFFTGRVRDVSPPLISAVRASSSLIFDSRSIEKLVKNDDQRA